MSGIVRRWRQFFFFFLWNRRSSSRRRVQTTADDVPVPPTTTSRSPCRGLRPEGRARGRPQSRSHGPCRARWRTRAPSCPHNSSPIRPRPSRALPFLSPSVPAFRPRTPSARPWRRRATPPDREPLPSMVRARTRTPSSRFALPALQSTRQGAPQLLVLRLTKPQIDHRSACRSVFRR